MTYVLNMASGKPHPDDELIHHHKPAPQHRHPEPVPSTEYAQLQLATAHLTPRDRNSASIAAGLNIAALLRSLED